MSNIREKENGGFFCGRFGQAIALFWKHFIRDWQMDFLFRSLVGYILILIYSKVYGGQI